MTCDPGGLARAAASFVGTPFRLHGRDRTSGLDCVGLLLAALRECGQQPRNITGYGLRCRNYSVYLHRFTEAGFCASQGAPRTGDVVQVAPGPGQLHLLIVSLEGDYIHAHAGIGRVVRTPHPLGWQVDRLWRLQID